MTKYIRPQTCLVGTIGSLILYSVGWADYISAYNLNFSTFYYIPIALWAWYLGLIPALLMAGASTIGWATNDYLNGTPYPLPLYRFWNIGIQGAAFLAVAICIYMLHRRFARERELNHRVNRTLNELERSVAEVRRLKHQALTICPVTHRIKVGGEWLSWNRFFEEKLHMPVTEGISEEALTAAMEKVVDYYSSHDTHG